MPVSRSAALNSDINITPLVDVCLVLLIIFMVALPMMVTGAPVALPDLRHGAPFSNPALAIAIKEDGTLYLDTLVIRREQLERELARLRASHGSVAIRADKRVAYGEVVEVLSACRGAGWEDVTLVGIARAEP